MIKKTVKLDKKEIMGIIEDGGPYTGNHYLVVSPEGTTTTHWADTNRQWDPWQEDDFLTGIPALFPDGSGLESELADDILRDKGIDKAKLEEEIEEGRNYASYVEYVEQVLADDWKEYKEVQLDWLAEAFLATCNGHGEELNDLAPWGMTDSYEEGGEVVEPPFEFEWK